MMHDAILISTFDALKIDNKQLKEELSSLKEEVRVLREKQENFFSLNVSRNSCLGLSDEVEPELADELAKELDQLAHELSDELVFELPGEVAEEPNVA